MKDFLNQKQIDYVFYHLAFHFDLNEELKSKIVFLRGSSKLKNYKRNIAFLLSDQEFRYNSVRWIDEIPVLFPLGTAKSFYRTEENNLIFNHDLLKSVFYLLSGYQELNCNEKDRFGRFPHTSSIQCKLNITEKPIVNYYFLEIVKGVKEYCNKNGIPFKTKKPYMPFGFILTHDIDKIEKYKWNYIGYKLKELAGIVKKEKTWPQTLRLLIRSILGYIRLLKKNNPYWSFDHIMGLNDKFSFRSTYFFLTRNKKNVDADFDLDDNRLLKLYSKLIDRGDEIGVHGTVSSSLNLEEGERCKELLEITIGRKMEGIRQHRLCYSLPDTSYIHHQLGYKYDVTLGFAEHIGFRNSYCHPFRLYNFDTDEMYDTWQIPLTVMDISLFAYQKYNTFEAGKAVRSIIQEIKKFNGLFTLLWHNTFLDEDEFKGIQDFYYDLLDYLAAQQCISLTASEVIHLFSSENQIFF